MPELPEVETMVRGLRPAMAGSRITSLEAHDPKMLPGCTPGELADRCAGAVVAEVGRRGKWVVIALEGTGGIIVIQPRMTGGFWLVPPDRPAHVRLTFRMEGPREAVWYCDARRLGRIAW